MHFKSMESFDSVLFFCYNEQEKREKGMRKMKIVLLHGLGQHPQSWQAVQDSLEGAEIDCPDLFTLTEGEPTYAAVLAALEERYAAENEPFVMCGLSLGAILALDYATHHPEKLAGLVLISVQYKVPRLLTAIQNFLFRQMSQEVFAEMGITKQQLLNFSDSMKNLDLRGEVARVKCPVRILCGEQDKPNRKASEKLHQMLPQSTLRIVPGAGHEMNREKPDAIVEALREWMN